MPPGGFHLPYPPAVRIADYTVLPDLPLSPRSVFRVACYTLLRGRPSDRTTCLYVWYVSLCRDQTETPERDFGDVAPRTNSRTDQLRFARLSR